MKVTHTPANYMILVSEKNRIVPALMRVLLEDAGMDLGLWPLTISTVELIINCMFTKSNDLNLTPHEVLYGTPPELSNLRVFGCLALMNLPIEVRHESTHRSETTYSENEERK